MNQSIEILDAVFAAKHAELDDARYKSDKELYLKIRNKLAQPIGNDSVKKATLQRYAEQIFLARNVTSIHATSQDYCDRQRRKLLERAREFFPWIEEFLKCSEIDCRAEELERSVIAKIDVFTQAMFSAEDPRYIALKNSSFPRENCQTPVDFLLRGLFYSRARQTYSWVKWILVAIVAAIIAFLFFVRG